MKKTLFIVATIFIYASCVPNVNENEQPHMDSHRMTDNYKGYYLTELSFNGETHEYVRYSSSHQGGLAHWEGCKYCKEHNN